MPADPPRRGSLLHQVDRAHVEASYNGHATIGHWAEPDLDHAAALLREVLDRPTQWAAATAAASQSCLTIGDPDRVAGLLLQACGL